MYLAIHYVKINAATSALLSKEHLYSINCIIIKVWYCSDASSHLRGEHRCVGVNICVSDQAKSFESGEFTQQSTGSSTMHIYRMKTLEYEDNKMILEFLEF